MADKPAAEKTEQPTPRKLSKARAEGQVPQSQEMGSAVTLMVLLLSVTLLASRLFEWFRSHVEMGLAARTDVFTDVQTFNTYFCGNIADAIMVTLPILAALLLSGIGTCLAISGGQLSFAAIKFKWDAINPATVIGRATNPRSAVRMITSIAKLLLVSLIMWFYLKNKAETLATLRWAWSTQIIIMIAKIIFGMAIRVGIAIIILGAADAFYQKWQYMQDMKMTRQEVKLERRSSEGSPEVKSKIRQLQLQTSMKRLSQDVPKADVILVNPTHVAVALRYDGKTMEAPVLLAKGADHMAQKIIKIGRSYGIPIVRRPEVARAIYASVKPGQPIPESLYMAVAEVLAMLFRLRQKKRAARQEGPL